MELIDAQIHPLRPASNWSPTFTKEQKIEASVELALAAMDAVGVHGAVVNGTLDFCRGHVDRCPDRFAAVPFILDDQLDPSFAADEFVDELAALPGIVGMRMYIGDEVHRRLFVEGRHDRYFSAASRTRLPVFITPHGATSAMHDVFSANPDVTFVVDHLGLYTPPIIPDGVVDLFGELEEVLSLAQHPNVVVKLTGAPSLASGPYPFSDIWPLVHRFLDGFGVGRLMWGSDLTRCAPLHCYRESVDFLLCSDEVSESDKEMLFSGSVRRWLDWPKPAM